jgi:hypothetical protein
MGGFAKRFVKRKPLVRGVDNIVFLVPTIENNFTTEDK